MSRRTNIWELIAAAAPTVVARPFPKYKYRSDASVVLIADLGGWRLITILMVCRLIIRSVSLRIGVCSSVFAWLCVCLSVRACVRYIICVCMCTCVCFIEFIHVSVILFICVCMFHFDFVCLKSMCVCVCA